MSGIRFIALIPNGGFEWTSEHKDFAGAANEHITPNPQLIGLRLESTGQLVVDNLPPPREEAKLHVELANTPTTPEAILQFASTYGWLGIKSKPVKTWRDVYRMSESFSEWKEQIDKLNVSIQIWNALLHRRDGRLRELLRKTGVKGLGSPGTQARQHLCDVINSKLYNNIRPQLHPAEKRPFADDPHLDLGFVVTGAGAAAWLQFAQDVSGNRDYRTCDFCQEWFLVAVPRESAMQRTRRGDMLYCSRRCKNAAAYRRRKEAKK